MGSNVKIIIFTTTQFGSKLLVFGEGMPSKPLPIFHLQYHCLLSSAVPVNQ